MDENIRQTAITQKWLGGIGYEIAFWNNVYRWPHTFKGLMGWSNYGSVIDLEGFDANSFLLKQDLPKVYDVGAGMSYAVGTYLRKQDSALVPLDVHYMDPLALHYNKILRKYKRNLPNIEIGMLEYLSAFLAGMDVSLITIQNALDHSVNPIKGIVESLCVLQEGGILYLNHHPNEAEMEKYKGFHQYNIDEEKGELIIWNRKEHINVSQLLAGVASVEAKRMESGHVVAIITKRFLGDKLPARLSCLKDDMMDKGELCQVLLQYQYQHMSFRSNLKDTICYYAFSAIQFFAQMMPWSLKMRVKHLLGQA